MAEADGTSAGIVEYEHETRYFDRQQITIRRTDSTVPDAFRLIGSGVASLPVSLSS